MMKVLNNIFGKVIERDTILERINLAYSEAVSKPKDIYCQ